ncbi:MAG: carbohydrate binding domain-containing protein [Pyrinomonadaceae bacterium]|nr:carbohydrate binding domain-containing protein [Pyrinomonadaceae bacterium]
MTNLRKAIFGLLSRAAVRFVLAIVATGCCLSAAVFAVRAGLSNIDSKTALASGSLAAADEAVGLTPSDPNAHFARAIALSYEGESTEAVEEYRWAVALRPRDYFLWLALGTVLDQSEDKKGALAAYKEAVRLAPYYAQPRWQLGNLLLRAGQREEAFVELRLAASSDSSLLPALLDLAWGVANGDANVVEQIINPQTARWHLALSHFFIKHGKTVEGLVQFRAAGQVSDEERRSLLQELLSANRFQEAYEIWSASRNVKTAEGSGLVDGGFEDPKGFDQPGFGWQRGLDVQGVAVSLDVNGTHSGKYSLRLNYRGDSNVNAYAISQLVVVEPNSRYRLRFSAKTQDVVTAGAPLVVVSDAGDKAQQLAQSEALSKNTDGWRDYAVEFATGKETNAVRISVQRQACTGQPCPIFGSLWLDDFILEKF